MLGKRQLLAGAVAAGLLGPCVGLAASGTREQAIELAQQVYQQAQAQGMSFERGPCLGVIMPGWVADVAHEPRQPVDNQPENQCAAWRSGQAKHFVELDPRGNVIRVH